MTPNVIHAPIIHGGIEKAASSFLQRVVFPNLTEFSFKPELRDELAMLGARHVSHMPDGALGGLKAIRSTRSVASAEGFLCLRCADMGDFARDPTMSLINLRAVLGPDARLLVVVRRQDSAIDSMIRYKQRYLSDPDSFLVDFPRRRSSLSGFWKYGGLTGRLLQSYNYYRHLAAAVEILGRDQVSVLVYEDLKSNPEGFFDTLGTIFGEDLSRFLGETTTRVNAVSEKYENLPSKYVPMSLPVRRLNNLTGYRLEKILPRRTSALTDRRRREIRRIFKEDNIRLADMFQLDLEQHGYY